MMQRSIVLWIVSFLCTSMVTSAASIRATSQDGSTRLTTDELERRLQQGEGGFWSSFSPSAGGGEDDDDGFLTQDEDGNGTPDWIDTTMPDWETIDWANISFGDVDWSGLNWNTSAWGQFLEGLLGGQNTASDGGTEAPFDFCPILQSAVGIGQSFGIAGNCTCDGIPGNGLMIDCDFKECTVPNNCTDIGLNFTFNDTTGIVNASICVDAPGNVFEELCFSYQLDMPATGDDAAPEQTCEASYAGKPCGCTIEGLCVALDCSSYLPGARMDTCQDLSFLDPGNATSLIPNSPVFNETFNGSFSFGSVNWTNLDWANVDWNNFGFDRVNWTGINGTSIPWGSLFNASMGQSDICPILSGRVLNMDANMVEQDCTCTGDLASGFSIKCSFDEECVATNRTGDISTSQASKAAAQQSTICGDLALEFDFNNLDSINGSLCADFIDDVHPRTCINYSIPIADQGSQPQCEATYGDKPCKCSIDESLCVKVDCSAYESTAVMEACQDLSLQQQGDAAMLIPRFGIPSQTSEGSTATQTEGKPTSESTTQPPSQSTVSEANNLNADNSGSTSRVASLALVGASILLIISL